MILGIDFGTCFSSVATMFGRTPVTDFMYDPNKTGTPSLFMYSKKSGKELLGYECLNGEAMQCSADVVKYMKRIVRENPSNLDAKVTSGGKKFTVRSIVKKYLTYLLTQAKSDAVKCGEFENPEIEAVTVTAPIGIAGGKMTATDYNKFLIETLTEITGLPRDKINIVQEPVAAAISYFYSENIKKKYTKPQTVLVFDLGGGTLDVTVVRHDPARMTYEIKAKEGDLTLGGNDWDCALGAAVLKKAGAQSFDSAVEKSDFENKITKMKIELSVSDEAAISFKHNGATKMASLTRSEFESATKALLDRAIEVTDKAMANCRNKEIDKIVLVGGSCNMPQIRARMIAEYPKLGASGVVTHDPSRAIAKGAAIFNKMKPTETESAIVEDIVTHTYGFNAWKDGEEEMIYNLLFKGTGFEGKREICVKSDMYFWPLDDKQKSITFTVYESDGVRGKGKYGNWMPFGADSDANGMEVTVPIPEDFIGRAKGYTVWLSFRLDIDGVLEIIVTDGFGDKVGYVKKQL